MKTDIINDRKMVTADTGTVITDYTEDMGILNYSSSTFMICPVDYDLSRYREIPLEEDGRYLEEQIRELERQKDGH